MSPMHSVISRVRPLNRAPQDVARNPELRSPHGWQSRIVAGLAVVAALCIGLASMTPAATIQVPAGYATIQAAINAASPGDTVNVAAGTYTEQVTITKSLNLIGAGEATTAILAPVTRAGSVAHNGTTHDYLLAAYAPSGTIDVRVQGFTLDVNAQNKTSGPGQMDGVFFRNVKDTGGTMAGLFSSTVHNFAATPDYEGFGVVVYGDSLLTLNGNDISDYTRNGICINRYGGSGSNPNVTISGNTVTGTAKSLNGISVDTVTAGAVTSNTVTGNFGALPWASGGIVLWTSTGVPITGNHVDGNFYGINLQDGSHDVTVSGNELTDNVKRGITLDASDNNTVSGNTIIGPLGGTDDVAIGVVNTSTGNTIDVNIIVMAITGTGNLYAIHVQGDVSAGSNTLKHNMINGSRRGIQIDPGNTGTTTIESNEIRNTGTDANGGGRGIAVLGDATHHPVVIVRYNDIHDNAFSGIDVGGDVSASSVFQYNTVSNNWRGIESNSPITATFNALVGNVYGGFITHYGSSSSDPSYATNNWWGHATGPSAPTNPGGLGNAVNDNGMAVAYFSPWLATDPFTIYVATTGNDANDGTSGAPKQTIQAGVSAVFPSGTVNVVAGTYTEQVTITKSLGLIGNGRSTTTILAPTIRTGTITDHIDAGRRWDYIVGVSPASGTVDVRIQGFTLDANGTGIGSGAGAHFAGVFMQDVKGATAGVFDSEVRNFLEDQAHAETTFGIQCYGDLDIVLDHNTVRDYNKAGIVVNKDDRSLSPVAAVHDNTVVGRGSISWAADNGIQFGWGAAGSITSNNVSANHYSGISDAWAAGILTYLSDNVTISDNELSGNQVGIYISRCDSNLVEHNTIASNASSSAGIMVSNNYSNDTTTQNTIQHNTITGGWAGIWSSYCSGNTYHANAISGSTSNGIYFWDTDGNTIDSNFISNIAPANGGWGIVLDGGDMTGTLGCDNNTLSSNDVTACDVGIWIGNSSDNNTVSNNILHANHYGLQVDVYAVYGGSGIAPVGLVLRNNALIGNTISGLDNKTTVLVDASSNYWGDASGPHNVTSNPYGLGDDVSANVDYKPWFTDAAMTTLMQTVSSITPATCAAGSGAFTLTVNGAGFTAASLVCWNGVVRTTAFVNSNQITAAITAGDVAAAGTGRVTVVNPGGTSSPVFFIVTVNKATSPTLSVLQSVTAGSGNTVTLTVRNTGLGAATNVKLTAATLGVLKPTGITLPYTVGTIEPSGSTTVVLTFATATKGKTLKYTLTHAGGALAGSLTVR